MKSDVWISTGLCEDERAVGSRVRVFLENCRRELGSGISRIFVLPNLVTWRPRGLEAICTSPTVIGQVLTQLRDLFRAAQIRWGNAPLQGCDWDRLVEALSLRQIAHGHLSFAKGAIEGPLDLRGLRARWGRWGTLTKRETERCRGSYVFVDLGEESLLEELYWSEPAPVFAVSDYPLSWTAGYHSRGRHVYVIHRAVLEADLVVSVPKLKTHEKVGITCALKGTVGAVARKECLPHFRIGGVGEGGDEYPAAGVAAKAALSVLRHADALGVSILANILRVPAKATLKFEQRARGSILGGAWHGNDTCWRMAIDVARILRYARPDGSLSDVPVREHIAIVDGIVAGEGEGPLRPTPRYVGALIAGADVCAVDYACALVMGFQPLKLPLIRGSFREMAYRLTQLSPSGVRIFLDEREVPHSQVPQRFAPAFRPPRGWAKVLLGDDL